MARNDPGPERDIGARVVRRAYPPSRPSSVHEHAHGVGRERQRGRERRLQARGPRRDGRVSIVRVEDGMNPACLWAGHGVPHRDLILNYFRAKKEYSSGVVEGLNTKVKLVTRKSYGYRMAATIKIARFHALGRLPEPEIAHRFA
jgi:hypothetical protein